MSFGIDSGISRNTNGTAQVAEKLGITGGIEDMTTHGAAVEVETEEYSDSFSNEAVDGQSGTSVVTGHSFAETNTDYARERKTTRLVGASAT